jgi:hypothetical protein
MDRSGHAKESGFLGVCSFARFLRARNVEPAGIKVEGIDKFFMSPSMAGIAVTGYNTNGWAFWEYFDQQAQEWKSLNDLR